MSRKQAPVATFALPQAFLAWRDSLLDEGKKEYALQLAIARITGGREPERPAKSWADKTYGKVCHLVPTKFSVPVAQVKPGESPEPKKLPKLDQALVDADPIDGAETLAEIKKSASAYAATVADKGSRDWWDAYRDAKHAAINAALARLAELPSAQAPKGRKARKAKSAPLAPAA